MATAPRELDPQRIEVHVAGVCIWDAVSPAAALRVLVVRRATDRELHPGLLEGVGGQVRAGEPWQRAIERHYRDEIGLEVWAQPHLCSLYHARRRDGSVIPGVRMVCVRRGAIDHSQGPEVRWLTRTELVALPAEEFVPGWQAEALALLDRYVTLEAHQP